MLTTVYLIRHGETDWNTNGRWQGHTDIPLNTRGFKQARLLARRLKRQGVHFNVIYSSDLTRAYQTAWEIGSAMNEPVELLPALREIDLGLWSGMTRDDIKRQYPDEFARLERGEDVRRGGGETLTDLRERVTQVIEAIVRQHHGETLAFVSHGGPVRMMLRYVCEKFDMSRQPCPHIGNTSINILHHHTAKGWNLVSCNDMHHLEGIPQAPDLMSFPPDDAEVPTVDSDWPARALP